MIFLLSDEIGQTEIPVGHDHKLNQTNLKSKELKLGKRKKFIFLKIHETLVYFGENLHERSGNVNFFWGRFRKLGLCVYRIKMFFFPLNLESSV